MLVEILASITVVEILCHVVGDYWLQNSWMAGRKRSSSQACFVHACCYALPFLVVTQHPLELLAIVAGHFLVDRFGLAETIVLIRGDDPGDVPDWCIKLIDQSLHVIWNAASLWLI